MGDSILVTGGAGFIGSHLVERLIDEGFLVDVVDDLSSGSLANLSVARGNGGRGLRFHKLDIVAADLESLMSKLKPKAVVHLAARASVRESMRDPVSDANTNLIGSLRIMDAARRSEVSKIVFATSAGVYGQCTEADLPISEESPHRPDSFYGLSKDSVLGYLRLYRDNFDLEYTALILANVYGPRQGLHGEGGVIARFVEAALTNRQAEVFGDGEQTRDFLYVEDAVDAIFRALEQGGGQTVNISTGVEVSVNTLHKEIHRISGLEYIPPHYSEQIPGEIARSALDPRRAGWYLHWHPFTSLERGLNSLIEWYRTTQVTETGPVSSRGRRIPR